MGKFSNKMPKASAKVIPMTGEDSDKGRLSVQDIAFIEALFRMNGDKEKAYCEIYPERAAGKEKKIITTRALEIVKRREIQEEIRARYAQWRATKPYMIKKLMEIAEHREPRYYNKKLIDKTPHRESVSALRLMAEMCGYITKDFGVQLNNIVVNFPSIYSDDEKRQFEQKVIAGERFTE